MQLPLMLEHYSSGFISGDAHVSLWVRPSGSRDGFNIPLNPVAINNINQTNINLSANVQGIRLSGTISFTYTGSPPVNTVYVYAQSADGQWYSGSSNIRWPSQNTAWSLLVPASASQRQIRLIVDGAYTDDSEEDYIYEHIFSRSVERNVSNQNITGISLNLGTVTKDSAGLR